MASAERSGVRVSRSQAACPACARDRQAAPDQRPVLVDLIETGIEAGEAEKRRFFDLARRFKESSEPAESERLREELARMIFGE